jgi:hypothetical protein
MNRWISLSMTAMVLAVSVITAGAPRLIKPSDILAVTVSGSRVNVVLTPTAGVDIIGRGSPRAIQFSFPVRTCSDPYYVSEEVLQPSPTIIVTCPNDACAIELAASIKASLKQHTRPNQTMKVTATFPRFGDAVLVATFLPSQIGLSPSGRSLSFSR